MNSSTVVTFMRYNDLIEVRGDDRRVLSSSFPGDDGQWHRFRTANYRRVK